MIRCEEPCRVGETVLAVVGSQLVQQIAKDYIVLNVASGRGYNWMRP